MMWMLLAALAAAPFQNLQHACGQLADVPKPSVEFDAPRSAPLLERRHQLLQLFSNGDGELTRVDTASGPLHGTTALYPVPWEVNNERREHVRLVAWQDRARVNDENALAMVLGDGESWCSSKLTWRAGARLRFEGFSIERDHKASLELTEGPLPFPNVLRADRQSDIPLEGTSGSICFRVSGGAAAIAEPRVVEPASEPDPRPRWMILTIIDSLRGDLVRDARAASIMPTLTALGRDGYVYERVVSPGCHTRASVWPILMGRDLMRVDPIRRRQSMPVESPLPTVYARANVFVSHFAESAGYHSVFLGNNAYLRVIPAFSRYSRWGSPDTGIADVMTAVPELMARYADERVLLVYYISAPHAHYRTPKRLFDALSCRELDGLDQCQCAYDARARYADEAIRALREGLGAYGLVGETVQIVTADHGELFEDGWRIEGETASFTTGERQGAFQSFNRGHGLSCHANETDVPLVVHGAGAPPARWKEPVSGLDIMPTLLELMDIEPVNRLDGRVLPLVSGTSRGDEPLVSYGFCSDSVFEGDTQLLWWTGGCRLRHIDDHTPVTDEAKLWSRAGALAASPLGAMRRHETWIRKRLGDDSLMFDTANLTHATIVVDVHQGVINDFGPASTVNGLDHIRDTTLSPDERHLSIELDGYAGLFHVSTLPAGVPVSIRVTNAPDTVMFVGPLQLPLESSTFDPGERPELFFADTIPDRRDTDVPALRLWWHRFPAPTSPVGASAGSQ